MKRDDLRGNFGKGRNDSISFSRFSAFPGWFLLLRRLSLLGLAGLLCGGIRFAPGTVRSVACTTLGLFCL
ncbi:hypothetical protein [uncultured Paracoccus sp.]|uniref:hypothetical protein n=1 Tax=uncultured Paracoccus sp. TaxID=189685 RepID=UPI0026113C59|nr:hypothetical protein [uncultured Paracoccus sp.]